MAFHRDRGAEATIALTPVEDPSPFGVVPTDERREGDGVHREAAPGAGARQPHQRRDLRARAFGARPHPGGTAGVDRARDLPALVALRGLYALSSDAYWVDTGTPEQFLRAQLDLLARRRLRLALPPATEVRAGVFVQDGVEIAGKLGPHSFVGAGASIAEGAVVEDSVVGAGSRIEAEAVVCRSVLLGGAEVGDGAVVEDSIVGPRSVIGEHARVTGASVLGVAAEVPAGASLDGDRYPSC